MNDTAENKKGDDKGNTLLGPELGTVSASLLLTPTVSLLPFKVTLFSHPSNDKCHLRVTTQTYQCVGPLNKSLLLVLISSDTCIYPSGSP